MFSVYTYEIKHKSAIGQRDRYLSHETGMLGVLGFPQYDSQSN